jgi:Cof subfamily protein (haloacid dehalogenase superfamily)
MGVRLVATDLDGTALREGLELSPRVTAAIAAVREAGIVVVFVTARNWRSVAVIAESAGVGGVAICSNGAVVYNLDDQEVLAAHHLDHGSLIEFMSLCREVEPQVAFAWESANEVFREECFPVRSPPLSKIYRDALQVSQRPEPHQLVTKVMVGHPTLDAEQLLERLRDCSASALSASISGPHFLEICADGITKAFALSWLCDSLGITQSEVIAVGDQPNDLPMLEWAGRGVAMGNSHPHVLAAIRNHTATNLEDGLALVLEDLLAQ